MTSLPPIPSWDGLHPLIVHFPVALLLVAPLFLLAGILLPPDRGRAALIAGLTLLVLGTAGTWIAVATGEAAGESAERSGAINVLLEQHESLAERTKVMFSGLTVALLAILFAPSMLRRPLARRPQAMVLGAFLVIYAAGAALLANAAHQGGRLVHELGVRATVASSPAAPTVSTSASGEPVDRDDD